MLCVTVIEYIGTHGPCTTAGQCDLFHFTNVWDFFF
jgi:hypothetical protein